MTDSDRITLLEARVEALKKGLEWQQAIDTEDLKGEQMTDAQFMALYSIVMELAERLGLSSDSFSKHYQTRFRWWHDHYLRRVEDSNPALAAEIDPRSVSDSDVSPTYPPLFDSPPPSQT